MPCCACHVSNRRDLAPENLADEPGDDREYGPESQGVDLSPLAGVRRMGFELSGGGAVDPISRQGTMVSAHDSLPDRSCSKEPGFRKTFDCFQDYFTDPAGSAVNGISKGIRIMKREKIGVAGAPTSEAVFLELERRRESVGLEFEQLHADEVGNFARVLLGRVGRDEWRIPVAVKFQRDVSLSREQSRSVTAKFDIERSIHRRLQANRSFEEIAAASVIRQIELNTNAENRQDADVLAPSILCAHATHALHPRCPTDGCDGLLEPDDWAQQDDDRRLVCQRCGSRHAASDQTRLKILNASIQRDPACARCPFVNRTGHEECSRSSQFLNFFPTRILIFELMDLDLNDYIEWWSMSQSPARRERPWKRFSEHRKNLLKRSVDRQDGARDLGDVLDLFEQILNGVEHLHRCEIAHL